MLKDVLKMLCIDETMQAVEIKHKEPMPDSHFDAVTKRIAAIVAIVTVAVLIVKVEVMKLAILAVFAIISLLIYSALKD